MIEVEGLTKRYGDKTAVDDLTFTVQPGVVTGFLGPNGAGKSTTMRMLLGLESPDAGRARVNGQEYRTLGAPAHEIGVLLDAGARHPGRSARDHLLSLAATHRIATSRVDELLDLVGLSDVARQRAGEFSLGMGQRLGIAGALLGDPQTIMLDEPVNGLDPEGIRWIRELLRGLAEQGRTVFVSSHLMSEMALTAQHLIVIGRGRLLADLTVAELVAQSPTSVRVRSPQAEELTRVLTGKNANVTVTDDGALDITGMTLPEVGDSAFTAGIVLHELTLKQASLEEAYMELTAHAVEFQGGTATPSPDDSTSRAA